MSSVNGGCPPPNSAGGPENDRHVPQTPHQVRLSLHGNEPSGGLRAAAGSGPAGLLKTERGRGPGSGVRGTPELVALLLISLLATGSLSEAGGSTRAFANLENKEDFRPLTGKGTFAEAVTAILASKELARRIIAIRRVTGNQGERDSL